MTLKGNLLIFGEDLRLIGWYIPLGRYKGHRIERYVDEAAIGDTLPEAKEHMEPPKLE